MSAGNIIAFGYHDQQAQRHSTLKKQFLSENEEFVECHSNKKGLIRKYIDLTSKYKKKSKNINTVIVMFPGHILMPIAWIFTRFPRKKLIFDAFISLWDTLVDDRKKYYKWNPISWILYLVDYISCFLADEILIDTEAHKKYFVSKFKINPKKIRVIYLETREDIFHPEVNDDHKEYFDVLFFGTFIPLQGIEYILDAAEILQKSNNNVHFTFIGSGQTKKEMEKIAEKKNLKNVTFQNKIPMEELPERIHKSDLCLGIFGTTGKAGRVIPHKVIDAIACGIPVLTRDSEAIRERYEDGKDVILCEAGSGEVLAKKILESYKL